MGDGGSLPIGFLLGVLSFQVDAAARNSSIIAAYLLPLFVLLEGHCSLRNCGMADSHGGERIGRGKM